MDTDYLKLVRKKAAERVLFLPHAMRQMNHPDRMISSKEVKAVVTEGDIIEYYPDDARGQSCLMLGLGDGGRPVHVVCAPKDEYLAIITAYIPDQSQWQSDWRTRKRK